MRFRNGWGIATLALAMVAIGCSSEAPQAELTGTVTYDGTPIADGAITFQPKDGQSSSAGSLIKDGQYSCKVPPGTSTVSITASKQVGKKKLYNTPNSPEMPITKELLPAKYNEKTELTYDAVPGKHVKNFDLPK
jgi:hypothetical protein